MTSEELFRYIKVVGKEEMDLGVMNPGIINFRSRKYFRYIGFIAVPPCTEGVVWTILKKVVDSFHCEKDCPVVVSFPEHLAKATCQLRTASREQIRALREAVDDGFENNARPTQPQDGRSIYLYSLKN